MADKVCVSVHRDKGKEATQGKEAFNKEEPKTNTQELWFCCRKENDSLRCSVRCRRSGCEDELACNVITISPSLPHHTHPHTLHSTNQQGQQSVILTHLTSPERVNHVLLWELAHNIIYHCICKDVF